MRRRRFMITLAIAAIILVVLANAADWLYFGDFEYKFRTRRFNKVLNERESTMEKLLNSMKPLLATEDHHESVPEVNLFSVAEKNKITILEFLDNTLIDWSDNEFDVPTGFDTLYYKPFIFLQNGWFLPSTIEAGNEKVVGLLRVRADFSLRNDIIKSGFEKEYGVPGNVGFSADPGASPFHIFNKSGTFLFALVFPEVKKATGFILLPILFWSGLFILILLICLELVKSLSERGKGVHANLLALITCAIIYLLIITVGTPDVFPLTGLFSPYHFSMNRFIPTLGHLLILGILCVFMGGVFYKYFPLPGRKEEQESYAGEYLPVALFFIVAALMVCGFHYVFGQLILTSNINLQPYKVLELNIYSLAAVLSVLFLLLLPVLFMLKCLRSLVTCSTKFILFAAVPSLFLIVVIFRNDHTLAVAAIFFLLLAGSTWITGRHKSGNFTLTVVFSFIFGLYSLFLITVLTEEKITEELKIQAVTLSTDNDPVAEHMLLDLWPVLSADTVLRDLMKQTNFNKSSEDVENISDYLRATYFNGYWANFNFNIVLCRNDDPLRVGPGNELFPACFNFFDSRIKRDGHQLTGTGFYFIDNQRGRSFYIGRMMFDSGNYIHGLFIELYGDVNVFQPGYSALLIDEKYHGYAGLKDYSFAKYINGELVLQNGDFRYDRTDAQYIDKLPDYKIFRSGGFVHLLYKNGNATVLISRPVIDAGDMIISFAYLFAFILLFSNLFVLLIRSRGLRGRNIFDFRQKLQFSFIGILLFSFMLIGVVVAYLTITQYKTKHYDNVKEKLNSVYLELESRLSLEKHLDANWSNSTFSSLNELMISLSNIFNTDINLYDSNGDLIATSRPEIFYRNLISTRINKMAWMNLKDLTMSEYYQKEKIGNLEYLSAYIPFFNNDDRILAYLNLPYFRIQSVLAKEISNLVVAVLNFTLLLILVTMGIAVVISGRLTAPLSMLGEGLASVKLDKKTEHLSYEGNDEIAELVRQYNRMVDELEGSAKKLANSEREYAWREMARQIAHEIKNPLTPMKLNVQQLLKSWRDKAPEFEERMEQFARNQIEYIDNLSSIATAFSSFAKMPLANPVEVNLVDQIRITLEIFRDAEKVIFKVKWPQEKKVVVFADREHLNGIFSNLIKNSIQSLPSDRQGIIEVTVEVKRDKAVVSIKDNGTGIPRELQGKLFTPNFTTKSSGTGLGLSIVKRYAENAGGHVWFESEPDRGATFFVELPLKYTVEKPV
ncbi:MAG: ATP-binding protein [Chloroflexota bacterium]